MTTFEPLEVPATDGNGTYALKFEAEIEAAFAYPGGSQYWGDASTATSLDVSSYEKICFGLYFLRDTSGDPELNITLTRETDLIRYNLLTETNAVFQEYALSLSDFRDTSGNPVSDTELSFIEESVEQIAFEIYVKGATQNEPLNFTLITDNLRFE